MEDPEYYEYTVSLETFSGPMELLLFLIRKEEVEIQDIPIAKIADQYLDYLEHIETIDLNVLGDYLVMASTLMVIKSRMLLPREEDEEMEEEELDPRADLVRQLLEYRKYREASEVLGDRLSSWSTRIPFIPTTRDEPEERPLKSIGLWELFESYSKIIEETSLEPAREIVNREIAVEEYIQELISLLQGKGRLAFSEAFIKREDRNRVIGIFLALLEMVKKNRICIRQDSDFGEITIYSKLPAPPPPAFTLLPRSSGSTGNN